RRQSTASRGRSTSSAARTSSPGTTRRCSMPGDASVSGILRRLARHPIEHVVRRWNWKSAVLSTLVRSALFLAANAGAGADAARAAFLTELVFRSATAGFYGAVTQAFRDAQPAYAGMVAAMVILPVTTHLLEFVVHWLRGTVRLAASIELSI